MRQFYHYLTLTGQVEKNIATDLAYPKIEKTVPHFLTAAEYENILKHCASVADGELGLRNLIIILLLGTLGLRTNAVIVVHALSPIYQGAFMIALIDAFKKELSDIAMLAPSTVENYVACISASSDVPIQLRKRFKKKAKVNFIRYADDFVITSASKELLEHQVKPVIEQFLKPRGLGLSAEKTLVTHIRTGFDFLGQNVRKYRDKLLITPSRRSVNSLVGKVRHILGQSLHAPAENPIWTLNPIIRGWGNYHRHVVSKKIFADVDNTIWHALWRWARRRHPNKSYRWIISRYFTPVNNHRKIFSAKDQKGRPIHLFQAASIPIRRHIKVRADANPYDPAHEQYFKKRLAAKRQGNRRSGRKTDG